jgi:hypothetical protein
MLRQYSEEELLGKPLTLQQKKELLALMEQRDEDIDLSDIPEVREIPPDAVRGKFYRPGVAAQVPVYLNKGLQDYLLAAAERKGITLSDLVNDLLSKEVAIVEAIK